jgi:protoporphyrinogen/coproporphyrinogen III oxidase
VDLIVAGAGAAGLGAAFAAVERGRNPLVIDPAGRPGGKLGTDTSGGFVTERAALGLLDRSGELARLAGKLGIVPVPASEASRERYVERDGRVFALPGGPGELIGTGLLSAREKLALTCEPFRRRAAPDATVAAFFERRLGAGGRFLGDAIQSGIYAGDPDRLEMATAFPQLFHLEQQHGSLVRGLLSGPKGARARLSSFRSGMQELVDALARRIGGGLRTSARVVAVRAAESGFRVQVEEGGVLAEARVPRLVLAMPAPQAAAVLETLDPELSRMLRELRSAPITLAHFSLRPGDVGPIQNGFGVLRPGRPIVGALFPAALWPGRAPNGRVLLSALVGGARHRAAASLSDDELRELARAELRLASPPELLRTVRWQEAIPQYEPGHGARITALEARVATHAGLDLAGAWYRGVGVLDCLRDGQRAAERLVG